MTSASELFPGRSSAALYPGGIPTSDFLNHRHPRSRHSHFHLRDPDGFDHPIRRSSLARLIHEQKPRGSNTSSVKFVEWGLGCVVAAKVGTFVGGGCRKGPGQSKQQCEFADREQFKEIWAHYNQEASKFCASCAGKALKGLEEYP